MKKLKKIFDLKKLKKMKKKFFKKTSMALVKLDTLWSISKQTKQNFLEDSHIGVQVLYVFTLASNPNSSYGVKI